MELKIMTFPSGVRMIYPSDTSLYVVTDVKTETMAAEFVFLAVDDAIGNYKTITRAEAESKEEELLREYTNRYRGGIRP